MPDFEIKKLETEDAKRIAREILLNRDVQLFDLIGGDSFPEAKILVDKALKNSELRLYYKRTEFERLSQQYFDRAGNPQKALDVIKDGQFLQASYLDMNLYLDTIAQVTKATGENEASLLEFDSIIQETSHSESVSSLIESEAPLNEEYIRKKVKSLKNDLAKLNNDLYSNILDKITNLLTDLSD